MYTQQELDQLAKDWVLTERLDLPEAPSIIVAGAYKGKLIRLLTQMYPDFGYIIGYEPQKWAYDKAYIEVGATPKVFLYDNGLCVDDRPMRMEMYDFGTDACSVLPAHRAVGDGMFMPAKHGLQPHLPCDLFIMNMEGYEYILLPYMLKEGMCEGIGQFAVQFHTKYATEDTHKTLLDMDSLYTRVVSNYPQWVYWKR